MIALLEMVCIAYQHTVCNVYHAFLDIMNTFYYVPFIDEYAQMHLPCG